MLQRYDGAVTKKMQNKIIINYRNWLCRMTIKPDIVNHIFQAFVQLIFVFSNIYVHTPLSL